MSTSCTEGTSPRAASVQRITCLPRTRCTCSSNSSGEKGRAAASAHTLVVGTITRPSVRVIKPRVPSAESRLIAEGRRILVLEREKEDFTGRVITFDADTGAVRKDWHVGELELPLRYLCAQDDLLIFGREKSLLLVQEGSSEVTRIKVPRQIDTYARCLFATR